MGTEIYNQNHHRHKNFHHRNGSPNATPSRNKIFLPTLCRLSLKDSISPHPRSICPRQNDPSSPKVSCMGQVKRHHHNNHHHHHLTPSSSTTVKHHHKIFSGNNKCVQTRVDQRRHLSTKFTTSSSNAPENKGAAVVPVLNLAELDPPLPVIKRLPPQLSDVEPVSLWKRRSRQDGQLTNIQIPKFQCAYSIQTSLQLEPPPISV